MSFGRILCAGAAAALLAGSAAAADVSREVDVDVSPAKAWAAIGDFCGIGTWHPAVEKCELSRRGSESLRTLKLKGGGTIVEKLVAWNGKKRSYTYAIVDSPLPVRNYVSTLSVVGHGKGSKLRWTGKFEPVGDEAKAKETIGGIYDAGLAGIAKQAGQ